MRALLDTSVLIGADDPGELEGAISAASLAELHFGVLIARDEDERARRAVRLGVIESTFEPLPLDAAVAREWGRLAAAVHARGGQPRRGAGPRDRRHRQRQPGSAAHSQRERSAAHRRPGRRTRAGVDAGARAALIKPHIVRSQQSARERERVSRKPCGSVADQPSGPTVPGRARVWGDDPPLVARPTAMADSLDLVRKRLAQSWPRTVERAASARATGRGRDAGRPGRDAPEAPSAA